jgi:S1-C subfamily serine protease
MWKRCAGPTPLRVTTHRGFDFFFGEPDGGAPTDPQREFRTQGLGSGVIVRQSGSTYYVITNDHVVGNADRITITLDNGDEYDAEIVGKDARKDLAMISFESDASIPVARLGGLQRAPGGRLGSGHRQSLRVSVHRHRRDRQRRRKTGRSRR